MCVCMYVFKLNLIEWEQYYVVKFWRLFSMVFASFESTNNHTPYTPMMAINSHFFFIEIISIWRNKLSYQLLCWFGLFGRIFQYFIKNVWICYHYIFNIYKYYIVLKMSCFFLISNKRRTEKKWTSECFQLKWSDWRNSYEFFILNCNYLYFPNEFYLFIYHYWYYYYYSLFSFVLFGEYSFINIWNLI